MDLTLGYEIGTGAAVNIPVKHMVISGMTQEAGKTTALEALATGSKVPDLRFLAFVTKRGERSFEPVGRVALLISKGVMSTGKRPKEIIDALAEEGLPTPAPRISEATKELVDMGFLIGPDGSGRYRAVEGMKINLVNA